MAARATEVLGSRPRWLETLVRRLLMALPQRRGLTAERLVGWLDRDRGFGRVWNRDVHRVRPIRQWLSPPETGPARLPLRGAIPPLATTGDLAEWLSISPARLAGLADPRGWHRTRTASSLQNYRRWWIASRRPSGRPRLLEAPKDHLRAVQRRILRDLLALLPPHPAAHGFVEGRSVWSAALVHAGEDQLVRFDLQSFFPSIHRRRVIGVFAAMGFPREVAFTLGALSTTRTPPDVLADVHGVLRARYADPHLPQGAPSSPMLANLCAYRLDARLAGLARRTETHYSRYADDLFFSGSRRSSVARLAPRVRAIVCSEGFGLNDAKARTMGPGTAHRCLGLVVNRAPSVSRRERERLEAILTNCVRHGPGSQNREAHPRWRAHLEGRVAWVTHIHPRHGARLRSLFDQVRWD